MRTLRVKALRILGQCTADPPVAPGDTFTVCNGDIRIPAGGSVCLWALQSVLPLIISEGREILEAPDRDWKWRGKRAQCPDPAGRVLFEIERTEDAEREHEVAEEFADGTRFSVFASDDSGALRALRVVVEDVRGRCTSGLKSGDYFVLRGGKLYIPAERHFCLHALHSVLPLLPAKQRTLAEGDWLREVRHVMCPDPAGDVLLRIEEIASPVCPSK